MRSQPTRGTVEALHSHYNTGAPKTLNAKPTSAKSVAAPSSHRRCVAGHSHRVHEPRILYLHPSPRSFYDFGGFRQPSPSPNHREEALREKLKSGPKVDAPRSISRCRPHANAICTYQVKLTGGTGTGASGSLAPQILPSRP